MHLRLRYLTLVTISALGLTGCFGGGSEPSEAEMKDAMLYMMNHPRDVPNAAPITIASFKKEACNKPNEQGFHCTFEVTVASSNIGAGMYNNVMMGDFYKDKDTGKWAMRPPF
jgi:hypothetical protein